MHRSKRLGYCTPRHKSFLVRLRALRLVPVASPSPSPAPCAIAATPGDSFSDPPPSGTLSPTMATLSRPAATHRTVRICSHSPDRPYLQPLTGPSISAATHRTVRICSHSPD
eukprot:437405-Prorocentrum_minimum.AAC.1